MRVVLSLIALFAGLAMMVAVVRALPPSEAEQRATATRLATLLPLLDTLGLDGWHDCSTCTPVDIRPGASPAPLPAGTTAFDEVRRAVDGLVPGGRLVEITTTSGPDDPGGRVVAFTAVARSMLGMESGYDLWTWTWHEAAQSPGPGSLDAHWSFEARGASDR